jgi:hypothetical protein
MAHKYDVDGDTHVAMPTPTRGGPVDPGHTLAIAQQRVMERQCSDDDSRR